MANQSLSGKLDKNFITIYFMQGKKTDSRIAIRRVSLILGIVLVLFIAVFFRVWQEMQVVKLGYEINQMRYEYNQALDKQRILLSQRNALASLERIESIARLELGLVTPGSRQLIFLVDPADEAKKFRFKLWAWIRQVFNE